MPTYVRTSTYLSTTIIPKAPLRYSTVNAPGGKMAQARNSTMYFFLSPAETEPAPNTHKL